MKKVKYFRKMGKATNNWYLESLGEPLDLELPNGKIMHFACEFYRGDGWRITEMETGLLIQNKYIPNKRALTEYIKDNGFLTALARITNTEYYEKQKDELKQFLKNKARPMSL